MIEWEGTIPGFLDPVTLGMFLGIIVVLFLYYTIKFVASLFVGG